MPFQKIENTKVFLSLISCFGLSIKFKKGYELKFCHKTSLRNILSIGRVSISDLNYFLRY